MERFTGRLLDLDSRPIGAVEGTYVLHGGLFPYYTGAFCLIAGGGNEIIRGWDYQLDVEGGPLLQIITSSVQHASDAPSVVRFTSQGEPLERP